MPESTCVRPRTPLQGERRPGCDAQATIDGVVDSVAKLLGTPTGGLHHIDDPPLTVSISRFVDISIDMEEFVAGARQQLDDCI